MTGEKHLPPFSLENPSGGFSRPGRDPSCWSDTHPPFPAPQDHSKGHRTGCWIQTHRDGPQTLPHPMTRATDNHRTASGPPAPQVTPCPHGATRAPGLGVADRRPQEAARHNPPPPPHPPGLGAPGGQPPASPELSGEVPGPPLSPPHRTGAQRAQDNKATEVPTDTQSCGPGGGQLTHEGVRRGYRHPTRRDGGECQVRVGAPRSLGPVAPGGWGRRPGR